MLSAKCRAKFALDDTNPDHVDIVIYNYRWRLSLANGEPQDDTLEQQLSAMPPITVPTTPLPVTSTVLRPTASPTETDSLASILTASSPELVTKCPRRPPQDFASAVVDAAGLGPAVHGSCRDEPL